MPNRFKIGPGAIIAAAFIGPGTITVCTLAGAQFGYSLIWALMISILLCYVLQETAGRIGIITQKGLGEIFLSLVINPVFKYTLITLIISAIVIGNAAYEAGNITGGVLGLQLLLPSTFKGHLIYAPLLMGGMASVLLYFGNYKILEKLLIGLVLTMSLAFLITAIASAPSATNIIKGLWPNLPDRSVWTVLGLIGTTVVPYNLFLYASLVSSRWKPENRVWVRTDTFVSVGIGGLISLSILITAIATPGTVENASDLVVGLQPIFGDMARYIIGVGLFAAGITSAITAPLAAAFVAKECFSRQSDLVLKDNRFRGVWAIILGIGVVFATLQIKPIVIIQFAQVANAIILPIIAILLWLAANRKEVLQDYTNSMTRNFIMGFAVLLTLVLSIKGILKVIDSLTQ